MLLGKGRDIYISVQWSIYFNQEIILLPKDAGQSPPMLSTSEGRQAPCGQCSHGAPRSEIDWCTKEGATALHSPELASCSWSLREYNLSGTLLPKNLCSGDRGTVTEDETNCKQ